MAIYRSAQNIDIPGLTWLFQSAPFFYRHLDWRPPSEWFGNHPIYLAEVGDKILAVLALPPEPPKIAWIRFYACAPGVAVEKHWQDLFQHCLAEFNQRDRPFIPALGINEWFSSLLTQSNFSVFQHIISLTREVLIPLPAENIHKAVFIRPMVIEDLGEIAEIDQEAFEPIWQNSYEQIRYSILRSGYATVAELGERIVGFQISTFDMFSAHLVRLAVRPSLRGQQIGYTLIADLIEKFQKERLWQITVNTQDNNQPSIGLYHKTGFNLTGDKYPVYMYQWL